MTEWESFWAHLLSGEWVADTGVPLALATLGLWLAGKYVKTQLKADRQLDLAQRHREFSADYAAVLRRSASEIDALFDAFSRDTAADAGARYNRTLDRILKNCEEAAELFNSRIGTNPFGEAGITIAATHSTWLLRILQHTEAQPPPPSEMHGLYNRQTIHDLAGGDAQARFKELALDVDRWDGTYQKKSRNKRAPQPATITGTTNAAHDLVPPPTYRGVTSDTYVDFIQKLHEWAGGQDRIIEAKLAQIFTAPGE